MDKDPMKRPTSKEVYEQLHDWKIILDKKLEELNEEEIKIKNKFSDADKIIPTLSIITQKNQDSRLNTLEVLNNLETELNSCLFSFDIMQD
ncbi:hypothetical protein F8M41_024474 [Gigaspora margarita]|uniref:Uncharacterized protein n=1 Tax=Gigaspora margarita TaxID=4874 RepID=A0A8H4AAL9_GIGMA|nr:hypothetical protein F8M41_024474 [Gigaspora margarita]